MKSQKIPIKISRIHAHTKWLKRQTTNTITLTDMNQFWYLKFVRTIDEKVYKQSKGLLHFYTLSASVLLVPCKWGMNKSKAKISQDHAAWSWLILALLYLCLSDKCQQLPLWKHYSNVAHEKSKTYVTLSHTSTAAIQNNIQIGDITQPT